MEKYTNTKYRRVGKSRHKPFVSRRVARFLLGCATVAMLVGIWALLFPDYGGADATEDPSFRRDPQRLTQLDNFRVAYLSAHFPTEVDERTSSMLLKGRVETESGNHDLLFIRKRPNSMRYSLSNDQQKMTVAFHEGTAWKMVESPLTGKQTKLYEGAEVMQLREQAAFFDSIIRSFNGDGEINKIELNTHDGREFLMVSIAPEDGGATHLWVDPDTLYPSIKREEKKDGTMSESRYSDYRTVKGIPIPFLTENFTDGVWMNRIVLESASINVGAISSVFQIPESSLSSDSE